MGMLILMFDGMGSWLVQVDFDDDRMEWNDGIGWGSFE